LERDRPIKPPGPRVQAARNSTPLSRPVAFRLIRRPGAARPVVRGQYGGKSPLSALPGRSSEASTMCPQDHRVREGAASNLGVMLPLEGAGRLGNPKRWGREQAPPTPALSPIALACSVVRRICCATARVRRKLLSNFRTKRLDGTPPAPLCR